MSEEGPTLISMDSPCTYNHKLCHRNIDGAGHFLFYASLGLCLQSQPVLGSYVFQMS